MALEEDAFSLESLLRSTPLRQPSERMDARVNALFSNFGEHNPRRLSLHRIAFHRLAMAAGIVLAIGIGIRLSLPKRPSSVAITQATTSHPIQFEQDTSTVYDDGIVASTDEAAYQQFRRRTVREIWYEDPKTHAKLQVVIPTEQVAIQKVESY